MLNAYFRARPSRRPVTPHNPHWTRSHGLTTHHVLPAQPNPTLERRFLTGAGQASRALATQGPRPGKPRSGRTVIGPSNVRRSRRNGTTLHSNVRHSSSPRPAAPRRITRSTWPSKDRSMRFASAKIRPPRGFRRKREGLRAPVSINPGRLAPYRESSGWSRPVCSPEGADLWARFPPRPRKRASRA